MNQDSHIDEKQERLKAVASEPGNRIRIQVVEDGEAVFTRWPDIDVRSARIVSLEERESGEDALC